MAIDLPPNPPAAEVEYVVAGQQVGDGVALKKGSTTYQIYGVSAISANTLKRAAAGADNIEDLASELRAAYLRANRLATTVHYLKTDSGGSIYVYEGRIESADVPSDLEHYFARFIGQPDASRMRFRRRAILADAHASMAGYDTIALYDSGDDPASLAMDVKVREQNPGRHNFSLGLSNDGNRFVGEYFAALETRYATTAGRQYRGSLNIAFDGEGSSIEDGDLYTASAGIDQITPIGTFDITATHTEYDYAIDRSSQSGGGLFEADVDQIRFDGRTSSLSLNAAQIAFVTGSTRLSVMESIQYVTDELERIDSGDRVLDETYAAVELKTKLSHVFAGSSDVRVALTPGVRQSFAESIEPTASVFNDASDEFTLAQLATELSAVLTDNWRWSASTDYQWAFDALPQNEEWVLGGPNRMAAWLPGVLIGDQGLYAVAAIEHQAVELAGLKVDTRLFVEYADAEFEGSGDTDKRSLTDAGIQLNTKLLNERLVVRLTSAGVIDDDDINQQRSSRLRMPVFASVAFKF